jgi:hypothetical protein
MLKQGGEQFRTLLYGSLMDFFPDLDVTIPGFHVNFPSLAAWVGGLESWKPNHQRKSPAALCKNRNKPHQMYLNIVKT